MVQPLLKNSMVSPQKLNMWLPYKSATPQPIYLFLSFTSCYPCSSNSAFQIIVLNANLQKRDTIVVSFVAFLIIQHPPQALNLFFSLLNITWKNLHVAFSIFPIVGYFYVSIFAVFERPLLHFVLIFSCVALLFIFCLQSFQTLALTMSGMRWAQRKC